MGSRGESIRPAFPLVRHTKLSTFRLRYGARPRTIVRLGFTVSRIRRGQRFREAQVHRYGSIAVIERFIKSLKDEWLRRLVISLRFEAMRHDLSAYASWFNEHRPHQALGGSTPFEVYEGHTPANQTRRFEPRTKWPVRHDEALSCVRLTLSVTYHHGRRHLPIIELKQAA